MGERAHTKGPWSVGFSDGSGTEWITAGDDTTVVMGGDSFGTVYGVRNPADARLIAAAPDMFEALVQAREWLRGWASAETQLAVIDAALAKASASASSGRSLADATPKQPPYRGDRAMSIFPNLEGAFSPAASDASPSGVRVKPLEWRHFDNGNAWANTEVGLVYYAYPDGSWSYRNGNPQPGGTSIDEAKAAAQADYDARILSALASDATPAPTSGSEDGGDCPAHGLDERAWAAAFNAYHRTYVGDDYTTLREAIRAYVTALAKPASEASGSGVDRPEDQAEYFIQAAIDSAPEPLQRLGEWLAHKLADDDWKTADRLVTGAAVSCASLAAELDQAAGLIKDLNVALAALAPATEGRNP